MRMHADKVGSSDEPSHDEPSAAQIDVAVSALALLADPTRLRILWRLSSSEHDVTSLATLAGTTQAATSQHLAKLRLASLVSVRQVGRRRIYSTGGSHVARLVKEALYYADHRVSGQPDHG